VAPQDAGAASATVTVGQQLGASVGTSLLNTIFAAAVTSYLTAARLTARPALTGLALAHGYDTAFWWTAGIFAAGAVTAATLLRPGPLRPPNTPPPAHTEETTAQAKADFAFRHDPGRS
jgi:Mn2+/Fe2+ NRAMP family transporter